MRASSWNIEYSLEWVLGVLEEVSVKNKARVVKQNKKQSKYNNNNNITVPI